MQQEDNRQFFLVSEHWYTHWNHWQGIDPDTLPDSIWEEPSRESPIWDLVEDIAYFSYKDLCGINWHVDIGFYPEMQQDGCYRAVLICETDWEHPVASFEIRKPTLLARVVETLFEAVPTQ